MSPAEPAVPAGTPSSVEGRWGRSLIFSVSWKSVSVSVSGNIAAKSRPAGVSSRVPRSSVPSMTIRMSMESPVVVVGLVGAGVVAVGWLVPAWPSGRPCCCPSHAVAARRRTSNVAASRERWVGAVTDAAVLDRAALVHRAVALRHLLERQRKVEDLAGVDLPVPDQLDKLGQEAPHRGRTAVQVHVR